MFAALQGAFENGGVSVFLEMPADIYKNFSAGVAFYFKKFSAPALWGDFWRMRAARQAAKKPPQA